MERSGARQQPKSLPKKICVKSAAICGYPRPASEQIGIRRFNTDFLRFLIRLWKKGVGVAPGTRGTLKGTPPTNVPSQKICVQSAIICGYPRPAAVDPEPMRHLPAGSRRITSPTRVGKVTRSPESTSLPLSRTTRTERSGHGLRTCAVRPRSLSRVTETTSL